MRTKSGGWGRVGSNGKLKRIQGQFLYVFPSLHYQGDQIKEDKLARARSTEERNQLGRHGRECEDSLKMDLN
jgi:hypothetical protein